MTVGEKETFKTAFEIDQSWIIKHASDRQKYICQGQSVNLFIKPDIEFSELHKLHKSAWEGGLKGLYYCRSKSINKLTGGTETDKVKPVVTPTKVENDVGIACIGCEG